MSGPVSSCLPPDRISNESFTVNSAAISNCSRASCFSPQAVPSFCKSFSCACSASGLPPSASSWISPELRERLAWHRSRAHEIVIVSASLEVYLLEVARVLPIDCVLSTRLEVDEQGRCTGRMLGANCRGPEKAARLTAHLGDGGRLLWAYGNSRGDDEMLALARHPVRVRRGRLRD